MIGLVIVTHGRLAEEFVLAMEHVVGPQRNVKAVCIGPDDDMERRRADILQAAKAVDEDQGVILLTDMFGGTPSNLAISVMEQTRAEVRLVARCLEPADSLERLPDHDTRVLMGVTLPKVAVRPFEASAPEKLARALSLLGGAA